MSDQLSFGRQMGAPVTSETECGTAGSIRVVLVLVENPDGTSVERLELREGNRAGVVAIENAGKLAAAVVKGIECSERRRARRAAR